MKTSTRTWWNGEPCRARRVTIIAGESPISTWWCAALVGQQREAVEVQYGGAIFYLDNTDGDGWRKVTEGKGSPRWMHRLLPVTSIVDEVDA